MQGHAGGDEGPAYEEGEGLVEELQTLMDDAGFDGAPSAAAAEEVEAEEEEGVNYGGEGGLKGALAAGDEDEEERAAEAPSPASVPLPPDLRPLSPVQVLEEEEEPPPVEQEAKEGWAVDAMDVISKDEEVKEVPVEISERAVTPQQAEAPAPAAVDVVDDGVHEVEAEAPSAATRSPKRIAPHVASGAKALMMY